MRFYPYLVILAAMSAGGAVSAADAPPPDNVTCINKALTPEDREIALVMFAESTQNAPPDEQQANDLTPADEADDAPLYQSEQMAEVFELLEEAHMRCLDLYPWNSGQSETARLHAFLSIIGEAIAKTLKLDEMDIAALDGFFETHKKKFANRNRLNATDKTVLATHLATSNWKTENADLVGLAHDYVETLMMRDMLRRAFDTGDFSKLDRL